MQKLAWQASRTGASVAALATVKAVLDDDPNFAFANSHQHQAGGADETPSPFATRFIAAIKANDASAFAALGSTDAAALIAAIEFAITA